jgi:hypothetical protein
MEEGEGEPLMEPITVTLVTLKGTWEKRGIDNSDVMFYRRNLRACIRNHGGAFDAVCHRAWSDHTRKAGTYTVTLPITQGKVKPERVARKVFEALMQQIFCYPPKITVLDSSTRKGLGVPIL